MRLDDFEGMVRQMAGEIPEEFLAGIADIAVSPRTVPHPDRHDIYTLGECMPLPTTGDEPDAVQSRVVLYHGSFLALARDDPAFDWREEAWETLTHEIRHHVEWRARAPDLEQLDWAAEQNFARHDGEPFDPVFYRDGERLGPGRFRVEDDYFVEVSRRAVLAGSVRFSWAGRWYRADLAAGTGPAFVSVNGIADPPPGELVLVLPRRERWLGLLRGGPVERLETRATDLAGQAGGSE